MRTKVCRSCVLRHAVNAASSRCKTVAGLPKHMRCDCTIQRILGTDLPNNQMTVLQTVRGLVKSGQLQFINGGWSMHDEACTHYVSMIENTAFGHRFLLEEFDYVPTVGWQIDPFGHSGAQASLLSSEVGFDALYFARIDWQEAKVRTREKSMEMMWQGSPSLGADAMVFTGAFLDGGYGPPPGFCFDQNQCNGGFPVMDDECMEDENVALYVDKFVAAARSYANNTRSKRAGSPTQNIMFLMGSDFQYENADGWYKNLGIGPCCISNPGLVLRLLLCFVAPYALLLYSRQNYPPRECRRAGQRLLFDTR